MGNTQATPTNASSQLPVEGSSSCPIVSQKNEKSSISAIPKDVSASSSQCPVSKASSSDGGGKCPISFFSKKSVEDLSPGTPAEAPRGGLYKHPTVYNVREKSLLYEIKIPFFIV
jgi:hypothetical protein